MLRLSHHKEQEMCDNQKFSQHEEKYRFIIELVTGVTLEEWRENNKILSKAMSRIGGY